MVMIGGLRQLIFSVRGIMNIIKKMPKMPKVPKMPKMPKMEVPFHGVYFKMNYPAAELRSIKRHFHLTPMQSIEEFF